MLVNTATNCRNDSDGSGHRDQKSGFEAHALKVATKLPNVKKSQIVLKEKRRLNVHLHGVRKTCFRKWLRVNIVNELSMLL